jgi:hypothetical protein
VRVLFWFLILAAAAVIVALAVKLNAGYALLVAPPYRIELSLNLLLLIVVGGFIAIYLSIRLVSRTLRLPQQVRVWRRQQKIERARTMQDSAVIALLEGRYGKSRQHAEEALAIPGSSPVNALIAARAAIDVRDLDAAEVPRVCRRENPEPCCAAVYARRGDCARARTTVGSAPVAAGVAHGSGDAHGGVTARTAHPAGGRTMGGDSRAARSARQAQGFRCGAGRLRASQRAQ